MTREYVPWDALGPEHVGRTAELLIAGQLGWFMILGIVPARDVGVWVHIMHGGGSVLVRKGETVTLYS